MMMKLKRKDIDDVNDDFSDFSLSSPARKIRRLDADLPPIMEEEEPVFVEPPPSSIEVEQPFVNNTNYQNEERAMVLFKPPNGNFPSASSHVTVSVDPDIISVYNRNTNRLFSSSNFPNMKWNQSKQNENKCLAVVPWVPLQLPSVGPVEVSRAEAPELMEADGYGATAMDVEDENDTSVNANGSIGTEGLTWQQQQQHCLVPEPPHSTSTPISWFR